MSTPVRPAITLRRLDRGDADDVAAVVAAAVAGALPWEVMPPDAAPDPEDWTLARERAYARFLRARPADEASWLVVEGVAGGGVVIGVARLAGRGAANLEAGVWLARTARGRGVGMTVLGEVAVRGRTAG
ncbi:GNAT family N-acetyltransferase [Actinomycetospora sp.]|jgi:RimJ/RimL family protein N-acetyltransferase|uniref:GNAT family N-acetyltransferase n=1 Tax=Actinomycetospora sp. TaxID=1872135 RepID=UPI002F3E71A1